MNIGIGRNVSITCYYVIWNSVNYQNIVLHLKLFNFNSKNAHHEISNATFSFLDMYILLWKTKLLAERT